MAPLPICSHPLCKNTFDFPRAREREVHAGATEWKAGTPRPLCHVILNRVARPGLNGWDLVFVYFYFYKKSYF